MFYEKDNLQWSEIRDEIKLKFSRLSERQLDELDGHIERLPGMVEHVYDYDYPKAVRECRPFTSSLRIAK